MRISSCGGELVSREVFADWVKCGYVNGYDGSGYFTNENGTEEYELVPMDSEKIINSPREWVAWYNK